MDPGRPQRARGGAVPPAVTDRVFGEAN